MLLRAALGTGGRYPPELAYLSGSTGRPAGSQMIFGVAVTPANADSAKAALRAWTGRWRDVAVVVGAGWEEEPYTSGDFENAPCVSQEALGRERRRNA